MSEMHKLIKHINQNLNAMVANQAMIYGLLLQYRAESHHRPNTRHHRPAHRRQHPVRQSHQNNRQDYPE